MNTIEKQNMQQSFVELKNELLDFIKRNNSKFSKQDFETHYYILKTLDNLIERLHSDKLPSKDKRYATLSSMVVELRKHYNN